jgi:hypothetical protein
MTIHLEAGAHSNPEEGMCAMELVAYVAGEPFTDRPQCTSKVIGAFSPAERPRLGLVPGNVVAIDEHRGSRRA